MNLRARFAAWLYALLVRRVSSKRPPDVVIKGWGFLQ
jgi:hypothetical protein